ncbi:MAG: glycosyltransferase family 4 protein [Lachnospiraceae bacterium]|nr:glycosyltransferase family 4 protein [Lachnospiraceae bacterium]
MNRSMEEGHQEGVDRRSPLRILVVTQCFYPDIYAVNDIVEEMVKRGHKVTVLTGLPDYTTSKIPPEYRHGKRRHEHYKGADVYRVQTIARHHGPIWRSLNYLSFVVSGSFRAWTQDFTKTDAGFDVIYVWEVSPVTMAVPAIRLAKRYRKPLFLYCMDIWPECVKAMGINERNPAFPIIHAWSRLIYNACDHIAVSSKPFFAYLEKTNCVPPSRMSYLPQYADDKLLRSDFTKQPDGHADFLFIGNIGKAQKLDCLIRAMSVFGEKKDDSSSVANKVTLHIVGGGSDEERIRELAHRLGLTDRIRFYGPKPAAEAAQYYKKADVCVLTLDGSTQIGDTLPGKLQTYMAAGKPVIAAANGATKEVIEESRCGICTPAGDDRALGEALLDAAEAILKTEMTQSAQDGPSRDDFSGKTKEGQRGDDLSGTIGDRRGAADFAAYGQNARTYFRAHFTKEKHFSELERLLYRMAGEASAKRHCQRDFT